MKPSECQTSSSVPALLNSLASIPSSDFQRQNAKITEIATFTTKGIAGSEIQLLSTAILRYLCSSETALTSTCVC